MFSPWFATFTICETFAANGLSLFSALEHSEEGTGGGMQKFTTKHQWLWLLTSLNWIKLVFYTFQDWFT